MAPRPILLTSGAAPHGATFLAIFAHLRAKKSIESEQWERMAVQVIAEIKDPRKSGPGGQLFIPGSSAILGFYQVVHAVSQARAGGVGAREKRQNRPGSLGRRARRCDVTVVQITGAALAPAAVEILSRADPFERPLHIRLAVAHARRLHSA